MSEPRGSRGALRTAGSAVGRVARAWRALPHARRPAAIAAVGLFLTLFLPWYQETVVATGTPSKLLTSSPTLTGWGAFSFVEAAVLLVAVGVLVLLFYRAEGRAFHVPGGDGWVITAAGFWTGVLIVWRMFDKQGTTNHGQYATTSGIEWGIFVALSVAVFLAYSGNRIRVAHVPEPPLPGEPPEPADDRPVRPRRPEPADDRPVRPRPPSRSAEPVRAQEPPRRRRPRILPVQPDEAPTQLDEPAAPPSSAQRPRSRRRDLNLSEVREIELADPPEAPTVRRPAPDDDELTMRLDRHD